jgi:hypothetical protein
MVKPGYLNYRITDKRARWLELVCKRLALDSTSGSYSTALDYALMRVLDEEDTVEQQRMAIKIEFSDDSLWGTESPDSGGYDEKASAEKYAELAEAALRKAYPDAKVKLVRGINDRTVVIDTDGYPDTDEAQAVDQIVAGVYESFKWLVSA